MIDEFIWYFCLLGILLFVGVDYFLKIFIKKASHHKIFAHPIERSVHKKAIPTGGGLVFALCMLIALISSTIGIHDIVIKQSIYKIIIGGVLILFLGFIDDKYSLKARYKLIVLIFISFVMVGLGFRISYFTNPFGQQVFLNLLSIPITVLWYLVLMNSINLIDGLDGLASGIAMITCLILMVFSFFSKNFLVFINSFFLFISLAAFLRFNYPPAKIFMGDSGSLFIGFILSSLSIAGNEKQFKGLTTFTLLVPVTVMFIPLGDTVFAIIRRIKNKQHIFQADKSHLHHKMLDSGLSPKAVTLLCWFITLIFGVIALGYLFVIKQIMFVLLIFISLLLIFLFFYIYKKELFK